MLTNECPPDLRCGFISCIKQTKIAMHFSILPHFPCKDLLAFTQGSSLLQQSQSSDSLPSLTCAETVSGGQSRFILLMNIISSEKRVLVHNCTSGPFITFTFVICCSVVYWVYTIIICPCPMDIISLHFQGKVLVFTGVILPISNNGISKWFHFHLFWSQICRFLIYDIVKSGGSGDLVGTLKSNNLLLYV